MIALVAITETTLYHSWLRARQLRDFAVSLGEWREAFCPAPPGEPRRRAGAVRQDLVLDATNWSLLDYQADLNSFRFDDSSKTFELDVEGNRVVYRVMEEQQLDLNLLSADWTNTDLLAC